MTIIAKIELPKQVHVIKQDAAEDSVSPLASLAASAVVTDAERKKLMENPIYTHGPDNQLQAVYAMALNSDERVATSWASALASRGVNFIRTLLSGQ
ncbi:hypothetical protein [Acerihabitans arboris]|uniref:Uncharacterized protein n=1 Tax=Acerihabitans arboris TaxID=2691583 RepID=A0A845SDQ8_9GAMM|nr:hypothetical protein [Acerihabitans arboris]NDL61507.1 hypothetical protein [Acerihabitans arboris]